MKSLSEMKIALASDHAGYNLKQDVMAYLREKGAELKDFGCYSTESCDYPDFAHPMAAAVEKGEFDMALLFALQEMVFALQLINIKVFVPHYVGTCL